MSNNNYKMVTLTSYLTALDNDNNVSLSEKEIELQVEKYILNKRRAETNEKIMEQLLS